MLSQILRQIVETRKVSEAHCQLHGLGKYPKEQRAEKYPMSDDSDRIDSFGELVNFDFLSELDLQQEDEIEKIFEFDC